MRFTVTRRGSGGNAARAWATVRPPRYNTAIGGREPGAPAGCPGGMNDTVMMDAHTLELLEFDKVRELLAGYAACSLGKELARAARAEHRRRRASAPNWPWSREMVDALGAGPVAALRRPARRPPARPPGRHRRHAHRRAAPRSRRHAHLHRQHLSLSHAARRPLSAASSTCSPRSRTWARSPRRSPAASTAAATSSTWPAANWPRSARSSPTSTSACRTQIRRLLRDPEAAQDPPLSQRHRQRRSLRPARRRQPSPQAPGRRPPHQQHRRDGVHRAGRRRQPQRRAGRPQGRGGPRGPPHPAPAQRRGGQASPSR